MSARRSSATDLGAMLVAAVTERDFGRLAGTLAPDVRMRALIPSGPVELWAACIAGAIPRNSYLSTLETAGFRVGEVRTNDYDFISERALDACTTYGVESISLAAVKEA